MPMLPFFSMFPDLAMKETRTLFVQGRNDLPNGEYGFVEFYCDEPDCDCRRVIIDVLTPRTGPKIWATINYGWESMKFYEDWLSNKEDAVGCKGPSLDPLNPQTEYSPLLLNLFQTLVLDEEYKKRLARHYFLFKGAIHEHKQATKKTSKQRRTKRRRLK